MKPLVFYEGGSWLIWTANEAEILLRDAGIMGMPTMSSPFYPRQMKELCLPIEITSIEAKWCHENGFCNIYKPVFPKEIKNIPEIGNNTEKVNHTHIDSEFELVEADIPVISDIKYKSYCKLREMGLFILDGSAYGCDYAIYQNEPWKCHAFSLLFCLEGNLESRKLIQLSRIADSSKKSLLLSSFYEDSIRFMKFSRFKPTNE